ncbi:MAG: SDR family NAD(P)-dependent oxidoreductase [Myxococcales bacterium]|nr:SDR family NAD(P)-dependent oxidoreductase [Myxococcales bacterium]
MKEEDKVWLITGCSTGMGREFAAAALEAGYRVVTTARNPATLAEFVARHPERARAVALDVTDRAQVEAAVATTLAEFGRIDVLVNNAAYGYLAAIEEGDEADVRAMFETNFWGVLAMTRAVLPHMRRQGGGHIVNNSSQAGLMSKPGTGFYSTTKWAVEALTEALVEEVAPFGIRVTALEPGPFRTDWAGRSMQRAKTAIPAYDAVHARAQMIADMDGKQPGDPRGAAAALLAVVRAETPPTQLLMGRIVLDTYRQKLDGIRASLDQWEPLALRADFAPDSAEYRAASEPQGLSGAQMRELVDRYVAAYNRRDVDAIVALYDPQARMEDPVGLPPAVGHEAIAGLYRMGFDMGVSIALDGAVRCAARAAAVPILATSPASTLRVVDVFDFGRTGLIERMRAYWGPDDLEGDLAVRTA